MHVITVRNVNGALSSALWWMRGTAIEADSRNGRVLMCPEPVATVYTEPCERVLFSELRDANPFFHLMESIWMLAGRSDVHFPARYTKQIAVYSDDGATLHGAYGFRWRWWFETDQLQAIIRMLKRDPTTRRAVLGMWDPATDLEARNLDLPCNTHAYFSVMRGVLDMTVCCRSNDAVWGAYGANAVHFSMLQQFIAEALGISVGQYTHISNNLHVYPDRPDVQRLFNPVHRDVMYVEEDAYKLLGLKPIPLIQIYESHTQFLLDAERFVQDPHGDADYQTEFFNLTVAPMQIAHDAYKADDLECAITAAQSIKAPDWALASEAWLLRRKAARNAK